MTISQFWDQMNSLHTLVLGLSAFFKGITWEPQYHTADQITSGTRQQSLIYIYIYIYTHTQMFHCFIRIEQLWCFIQSFFFFLNFDTNRGFPGSSVVKNPPANAGDLGSIPGSGSFPGERNGNPLQCSCLESPMDRGAWRAAVHGVAESQTRLGARAHMVEICPFALCSLPQTHKTQKAP